MAKVHIFFFCILLATIAASLPEDIKDGVTQAVESKGPDSNLKMNEEAQVIKLPVPLGKLRGEGNHFDMQITYIGPGRLFVSKPWLPWGKWVPGDNNYHDQIQSPEGKSILNGQSMRVSSAGRENSPSGTEGSFDLVLDLDGQETRLFYVYWNACYLCTAQLQVRQLSSVKHIRSRWGDGYIRSNMCVTYPGWDGSSCKVW